MRVRVLYANCVAVGNALLINLFVVCTASHETKLGDEWASGWVRHGQSLVARAISGTFDQWRVRGDRPLQHDEDGTPGNEIAARLQEG